MWSKANKVKDARLQELVKTLPDIVLKSRAPNTYKKYKAGFEKFCDWCRSFDLCPLPADDFDVAIYLSSVLTNATSVSTIDGVFYSIKWVHDICGLLNPCDSAMVRQVLEGAHRTIGKHVVKKEPISHEHIKVIVDRFGGQDADLSSLRVISIVLLGYAGFMRFSELANIRRSDLCFSDNCVSVKFPSSKTDQYREGSDVVIAKLKTDTCPVAMLNRYLIKAGIDPCSDEFIFRGVTFCKSTNSYRLKGNSPLSYTRAREIVLDVLSKVGLDKSKFGLHSLRSGGATAAARAGVSDRLFKKHGRWRSDKAKDGYVKEDLLQRLDVSTKLGL